MVKRLRTSARSRRGSRRLPSTIACALALAACVALTPGAAASTIRVSAARTFTVVGAAVSAGGAGISSGTPGAGRLNADATLEECVTAVAQAERSATFGGEMTAIPGGAHMGMRIDVLERMPAEAVFHAIATPGLGVWRPATPGVKVYKYLNKVTNLSAPAFYRASVRFRWLSAKGRVIRTAERRTAICEQPAPPASAAPSLAGGG